MEVQGSGMRLSGLVLLVVGEVEGLRSRMQSRVEASPDSESNSRTAVLSRKPRIP